VESYHKPSLHGMPSLCTGSPSSNAWRESYVPILSDEEEEANVPPTLSEPEEVQIQVLHAAMMLRVLANLNAQLISIRTSEGPEKL
jgi:hypothetical protein